MYLRHFEGKTIKMIELNIEIKLIFNEFEELYLNMRNFEGKTIKTIELNIEIKLILSEFEEL